MRRTAAIVGALALTLVGVTAPAQAHEHEHDHDLPRHGHVLILGVVWDGEEPVGFRKCVDLAGGRALPLKAHHSTVHQGRAGEALMRAGHIVAPTAPLWPEISSCADVEAMLGQ